MIRTNSSTETMWRQLVHWLGQRSPHVRPARRVVVQSESNEEEEEEDCEDFSVNEPSELFYSELERAGIPEKPVLNKTENWRQKLHAQHQQNILKQQNDETANEHNGKPNAQPFSQDKPQQGSMIDSPELTAALGRPHITQRLHTTHRPTQGSAMPGSEEIKKSASEDAKSMGNRISDGKKADRTETDTPSLFHRVLKSFKLNTVHCTDSDSNAPKNEASTPMTSFTSKFGTASNEKREGGGSAPIPSSKSSPFFDADATNDRVFWEAYKQSEQRMQFRSSGPRPRTFLADLKRILCWHWQRASSTFIENVSSWETEEKQFWLFFLDQSKWIALPVFASNVGLMLLLLTFSVMKHSANVNVTSVDNAAEKLQISFALYVFFWFVLNALCLSFFFFFTFYERLRARGLVWMVKLWPTKEAMLPIWSGIAQTVLYTRAMFFFYGLISTLANAGQEHFCFETTMLPEGADSFAFIAVVIVFDVYQMSIIGFFPSPWPWTPRLCLIECAFTLNRLTSCAFLIQPFPLKENIIDATKVAMIIYYLGTIPFSNLTFERSMRTSFKNIKRQHLAAAEKMQVVNMLCQEIKLPAQKLLQSLQAMVGKTETVSKHARVAVTASGTPDSSYSSSTSPVVALNLNTHIRDAKSISGTLNAVVDDLLFLAKVEEQRFTMHCQDLVVLHDLVRDTTELLLHSLGIPLPPRDSPTHATTQTSSNEGKFDSICVVENHSEMDSVFFERNSMRVMLFYSLLALLAVRCNDREEDFAQVLGRALRPPQDSHDKNIHQDGKMEAGRVRFTPIFVIRIERSKGAPKASHQNHAQSQVHGLRIVIRSIIPGRMPSQRASHHVSPIILRGGTLESACCVCRKVAIASRSQWNIWTDRVEFVVKCRFTLSSTSRIQAQPSVQPISDKSEQHSMTPPFPERTLQQQSKVTQEHKSPVQFHDTPRVAQGHLTKLGIPESSPQRSYRKRVLSSSSIPIDRKTDRLDALSHLLQTCVCYFFTERAFESMVLDVIQRLRIVSSHRLQVLRHVNVADLKVFSVVFVQSLAACREVREKEFRGVIVLFSERLAYLDEKERSAFDYGVALPCEDKGVEKLLEFLESLVVPLTSTSPAQSSPIHSIRSRQPSSQSLLRASSQTTVQTERNFGELISASSFSSTRPSPSVQATHGTTLSGAFLFSPPLTNTEKHSQKTTHRKSIRRTVFMKLRFLASLVRNPIPVERRESYAKWRFLAPLGSLLHHTSYLELLGVLTLLLVFAEALLGTSSFAFFILTCTAMVPFFARRIIYFGFLRHLRIAFSAWWYMCCGFIFFAIVASMFFEFFKVRLQERRIVSVADEVARENGTVIDFLESRHGITRGTHSLFFLINLPVFIRYHTEFFPWPWNFIVLYILVIRAILEMSWYFQQFLFPTQFAFLVGLLSFFCVGATFYTYFLEKCHFKSFTGLYNLLLSKDFLDRVLFLGKKNLKQPLLRLRALQATILDAITEEICAERVFLTRALHREMSVLRYNIHASRNLLFQLIVLGDPHYFLPTNRARFLSSMKAVIARRTVDDICERILVQSAIPTMFFSHIFVKIDPAIMLINVDEELFSTILTLACRAAIRRLEKRIHSGIAGAKDDQHEILLCLHGAGPSADDDSAISSSSKFDVRTLFITVLDSVPSSRASSDNGSRQKNPSVAKNEQEVMEENISSSICNKYMQFFGYSPKYLYSTLSTSRRYRHIQRFGIPYLPCAENHKLLTSLPATPMMYRVQRSDEIFFHRYRQSLQGLLDGSADRTMWIDRSLLKFYHLSEACDSREQRRKKDTGGIKRSCLHPSQSHSSNEADSSKASKDSVSNTASALTRICKFNGRMGIICNYDSLHYGKFLGMREMLASVDCICKIVHPKTITDLIALSSDAFHYDALFLDVDFTFIPDVRNSTKRSLTTNVAPSLHVDDHFFFETRDAIQLLRTHNFLGLIAVLHPNFLEASMKNNQTFASSGAMQFNSRSYAKKREKLEKPNVYADAATADLHISFPVTAQIVEDIINATEKKIIQNV